LTGCNDDIPWNDPYPYENPKANTLYSAFNEQPKHLDPARSYSSAEWPIIGQIYEPPLQYHYLKRPYELEPLTATQLPVVKYFDKQDHEVSEDAALESIAYSVYEIQIKPGIYYEPHPAFVNKYLNLTPEEARKYRKLSDFKETATRELIGEDYIYQIKRLAEPTLSSPIYGVMSRYIEGLKELRETLVASGIERVEKDLRNFSLTGVEEVDRYTYRIRIKGKYPEFRYWLAMPFFSPVPWEVARFYAEPNLNTHNITLDWYPVGTGPYKLTENNPERRMVLVKNPQFRGETYPTVGAQGDKELGLLEDAGKPIPMLDKQIYTLEREDIPYWNKFLQGYYDVSGIQSDNFGSSIQFNPQGGILLTEKLNEKGIRLQTSIAPIVYYWGFNMLDDVVGGNTESARKLRQAIAMAFDVEEFITIFLNGRGQVANGPIPTDVFGFEMQPALKQKNGEVAKELIKEAGYPNGLTLYFDAITSGNPDEIAIDAWLRKQFAKIGVQMIARNTDYNRFQEKIKNGSAQVFFWGWNADYPDPENFLSLFYGPNGSVKFSGENTANYSNAEYDSLFEKMRVLKDGPERLTIIQKMVEILDKDAPWVWGFYPKTFTLYHQWTHITKPNGVANNTLKYVRLDPNLRAEKRELWNKIIVWPIVLMMIILLLLILPAIYRYWRREHKGIGGI